MKKVVITQDMVKFWHIMHREDDWTPYKPYCKLCSTFVRYKGKWGRVNKRASTINYFQIGEEVYEVRFANNHTGYYHLDCIDNPKDVEMQRRVENIKRYDKDRWTELHTFLKHLREKDLPNNKIVSAIKTRFRCSRATAYRKLQIAEGEIP